MNLTLLKNLLQKPGAELTSCLLNPVFKLRFWDFNPARMPMQYLEPDEMKAASQRNAYLRNPARWRRGWKSLHITIRAPCLAHPCCLLAVQFPLLQDQLPQVAWTIEGFWPMCSRSMMDGSQPWRTSKRRLAWIARELGFGGRSSQNVTPGPLFAFCCVDILACMSTWVMWKSCR